MTAENSVWCVQRTDKIRVSLKTHAQWLFESFLSHESTLETGQKRAQKDLNWQKNVPF